MTTSRGRGFVHESSRNESIEWYTPPEIFNALDMTFDLDPCSPGEGKSFVPAEKHYTIEDDGLLSPWDGTVFMNPPYGTQTHKWIDKFMDHANGVALVFARTDVQWFQKHADNMDIVLFVNGRIRFYKGSITQQGGSPGSGSMLIGMGESSVETIRNSGLGAWTEGFSVSHS